MNLQKLTHYAHPPLRILAGITFIVHGLPKFESIFRKRSFETYMEKFELAAGNLNLQANISGSI
jgi:hypothetical protein